MKRMVRARTLVLVFMYMLLSNCSARGQSLTLVKNGVSSYVIVKPARASATETKAAEVLQQYLKQISGTQLPVVTDASPPKSFELLIGAVNRIKTDLAGVKEDGFIIKTLGNKLTFNGRGKGVLYSVYSFLDTYLGCKKYATDLKIIPQQKTITIPAINDEQNPQLSFRSIYYSDPENDDEFRDWYKLHRIEETWGLWGHSFFKLVPPQKYFKTHPEYFSLIDGVRQPVQLCLSNPEVLKIAIADLAQRIKENPGVKYWSVSQNDEPGGCECDKCTALNNKYHSAQGSILNFVNQVAAHFPDKVISTMAYTYSRKPPEGLKPLPNVNIMFSTMGANRSKPIPEDASSAALRSDFEGWQKLTDNIIVWDYVTQFTNYISPFPNLQTLQSNFTYFSNKPLAGFFIQGSVETKSEFSELRTYLFSRLLWDPKADVKKLQDEFLNAYYGKAAPYINDYITLLQTNQQQAGSKRLDIYDNPVKPYRTYLSPEQIDRYSTIMEKAAAAVEKQPLYYRHVLMAWLPLDYAVLQQARYYGIEPHGVFVHGDSGWTVKPDIRKKAERFVLALKDQNVRQLDEDGEKPDDYLAAWQTLFNNGPKIHKALGKPVQLLTPMSDELVTKGPHGLVDGAVGDLDFQINWLGWYGNDMQAVIDMQSPTEISKVDVGFLENQRHLMFIPRQVLVEISDDGVNYKQIAVQTNPAPEEDAPANIKNIILNFTPQTTRYIKVTALNQKELPPWRRVKGKLPWILADEIAVY